MSDFWARVSKSSGCWEWTGAISGRTRYGDDNYGTATYRGIRMGAHRAAWIDTYGPIPGGLWVLHHCDNRRCVRPSHLFLGTVQDNVADAQRKGRTARAAQRGPNAKLNPEAVVAIRASLDGRAVLASRYGVSGSLISRVRLGKAWPL